MQPKEQEACACLTERGRRRLESGWQRDSLHCLLCGVPAKLRERDAPRNVFCHEDCQSTLRDLDRFFPLGMKRRRPMEADFVWPWMPVEILTEMIYWVFGGELHSRADYNELLRLGAVSEQFALAVFGAQDPQTKRWIAPGVVHRIQFLAFTIVRQLSHNALTRFVGLQTLQFGEFRLHPLGFLGEDASERRALLAALPNLTQLKMDDEDIWRNASLDPLLALNGLKRLWLYAGGGDGLLDDVIVHLTRLEHLRMEAFGGVDTRPIAMPTSLRVLSIGLRITPSNFGALINLTELDVSTFVAVSDKQLRLLTNLRNLNSNGTLTDASLQQLTLLETLTTKSTLITYRDGIAHLRHLTALSLYGNALQNDEPDAAVYLTNLRTLELDGEREFLEEELRRMTRLESLAVSGENHLFLPANLPAMTQLTDLRLAFAPVKFDAILPLVNLRRLFVTSADRETITTLPPSLEVLGLKGSIHVATETWAPLTQLRELYLYGRFDALPAEPPPQLRYFHSLASVDAGEAWRRAGVVVLDREWKPHSDYWWPPGLQSPFSTFSYI